MTNKPMLSVERELLQTIVSVHPSDRNYRIAIEGLRALLDKQAAQHQGEPVAWSFCPECGCKELHHEEREHKQCKNCHQEWFSDIDYSETVRWNLQKLKAVRPAPVAVVMPERKGSTHKDWRDWSQEEIGYNKALEDVARLNGVKP